MPTSKQRLSAVSLTRGYLAAILILVIGLGGCVAPDGPKVVSLEEAKKITATFEERVFSPPPRTIGDITRVLAQEKPEDLQFFQKSLEMADAKQPDTTDPLKLAEFYLQKGHAAHEVGRAKQEIEDYGLAVRYGKQSGFSCLWVALTGLAAAEERAGSLSRAVEIIEELLSHLAKGTNTQANTAIYSGVKAFYCVRKGDLQAAQQAVKQAEMAAMATENRLHPLLRNAMNSTICRARASVLEAMGNLAEAEVQYTKAVALWEPLKDERGRECDTPKLNARVYNLEVYELGQNLLRQGRLVEAEIQARKALTGALRSHGRYSAHTVVVSQGLNEIIFEQGRYEEAETLARANLAICRRTETSGDSTTMAFTRSSLADSLLAQKRWKEALTEYDGVCDGLKADRAAYEHFISTRVNLWLALIKGGRGADALKIVQPALERKRTLLGESHYDTAEARGIMAMAMVKTGDRETALAEFAKAMPVLLERASRSETVGERQTALEFRLGLILDAYIQLLAFGHGTVLDGAYGVKATEEAFRLADAARGRTVKRALAAASARAAAKDPGLADLARAEQDALAQIGALNTLLSSVLSAPSREQSSEGIKDIRSRIDSLRSARDAIRKEINGKFPDYANLVEPKPMSIEEARSNLRPGEALIATYVSEDGSYVWAIPQQGAAAFASTGLREKQIAEMVGSLRQSLDPQGGTLGSIPEFDLKSAHRLYEALLKPVESGWKTSKSLLVVAHGALGFVPFSVLTTQAVTLGKEADLLFSNYRAVPWLARTHAVTTLPSVASLRTLRSLSAGDPARKAFTGFGNPYFSRDQEKEVQKEIRVSSAGTTRGMAIHRRGLTVTASKQTPTAQRSKHCLLCRIRPRRYRGSPLPSTRTWGRTSSWERRPAKSR